MNFRNVLASLLSISAISLVACSGPKYPSPPPGGGTATVSFTLTAAPLTPPPSTNLLSFIVDVNTITLTSSTGTNVNIPLNAASFSVDLTQLQGNIGCAPGSVTTISGGAAATPKITSAPFPLTLTANQKTGLAINFNLGNALTVNTSQVVTAVNLAATNVLTAATLPSTATSLSPGQLDFVEDVTGIVTAANSVTQSVTVKTATRGSITAVANSSTVFSPNCTAFLFSLAFSSCVVAGQVASIDTVLSSDGTFTLLEYDPLSTTTGDWIEGIVSLTPTASTQFTVVTNDLVLATSGSV